MRIRGRDFYLGKYGTPASLQAFDRLISEWLANSRQVPVAPNAVPEQTPGPTISELFVAYWAFAEAYYVKNGHLTGEVHNLRDACRPLSELYGPTPVGAFGPRSLKAVRHEHHVAEFLHRSRGPQLHAGLEG